MKNEYREKYNEFDGRFYFRQLFTFLGVKVDFTLDYINVIGQFIYDDEIVFINFDRLLWDEDDFNFPKYSDVEIIFALTVHDETLINYPVGLQAI